MALVIEYANRKNGSPADQLPSHLFPILLTFAHIDLCWQISRFLLVPVCQHAGANFTTWTPLAWLPGAMLTNYAGLAPGMACMFLASVLAAHMMQRLLTRYRDGLIAGRPLTFDWQLWATLAAWFLWLPVPATDAFVFHFSDWAITH